MSATDPDLHVCPECGSINQCDRDIEAEAGAEVREDLARQVAALPSKVTQYDHREPPRHLWDGIDRATVLAILQAPDPLEGRTDG